MRRTSRPWRLVALLSVALAASCSPTLDDRPWLVTQPQIIGLEASSPEVRPGTAVTFEVVALDPAGPVDTRPTTWAFCSTPKPPAEANVVAPGCLAPAAPDATGSPVSLTVPTDACAVFGPDPPQPAPGQPSARPADPDATGGYYQPIAIALSRSLAVGLERVICDLPQASLAAARAFQAAYVANVNPMIAGLTMTANGAEIDAAAVAAGTDVQIAVSWPAGTAESFALFDRASASVVEAQETLTASWFVTGGDLDRAAVETSDPTVLSAAATWTAPGQPGPVQLAVTLRDSRGGMDAMTASLLIVAP
ncbi:MAG TPA: hypothetical protein VKZ18_24440 [Polyangia bacterium]|nr:hypothetical protein [Polyangia bacterium]